MPKIDINNPTIKTSYNADLKKESKIMLRTIKSNLKQRAEEDLALLEAGSMSNKLSKFSEKVKKNHGVKEK
jgi:hypothetical protein